MYPGLTSRTSIPFFEGGDGGGGSGRVGGGGSGRVSGGGSRRVSGGDSIAGGGNGGDLYVIPYEAPADTSDWPRVSSMDSLQTMDLTPFASERKMKSFRKKPTRASLDRLPSLNVTPTISEHSATAVTDALSIQSSKKVSVDGMNRGSFEGETYFDVEAPAPAPSTIAV